MTEKNKNAATDQDEEQEVKNVHNSEYLVDIQHDPLRIRLPAEH